VPKIAALETAYGTTLHAGPQTCKFAWSFGQESLLQARFHEELVIQLHRRPKTGAGNYGRGGRGSPRPRARDRDRMRRVLRARPPSTMIWIPLTTMEAKRNAVTPPRTQLGMLHTNHSSVLVLHGRLCWRLDIVAV